MNVNVDMNITEFGTKNRFIIDAESILVVEKGGPFNWFVSDQL